MRASIRGKGAKWDIAEVGVLPIENLYRVEQIRQPGIGGNEVLSTITVNRHMRIREIPEETWDNFVDGMPALAFVIERQAE